jgi:hypothetical protein
MEPQTIAGDTLRDAVAARRHVRIRSAEGAATAALLPSKRPHGVAFEHDAGRFLRIVHNGRADLNGGLGGPWTELSVCSNDDGTLGLKGVKSGLWLAVVDGEFTSSERSVPLLLDLAVDVEQPSPKHKIVLSVMDGAVSLPMPVSLRHVGPHTFLETGSGNLACGPQGAFTKQGKEGKWAQWCMEQTESGLSFQNVGHGRYLSLSPLGHLESSDEATFFRACDISSLPPQVTALPEINDSVLSPIDLAHFKEQGYVILRQAVPPDMIKQALRSINFQLGKADLGPDNPVNLAQDGMAKKLFNTSPVMWSALNVLLGPGNVLPWNSGAQVALRFPLAPEHGFDVPDVKPGTAYHIDGMGQNKLCPFSLLCGVALSDQLMPNRGNLHVFPGSHLHEDLRKHYLKRINDPEAGEEDETKPNLGKSTQVLLGPGDVVIAHQLLAHRVGVNTGENIRYQLYYRVSHKDHASFKESILDKPWIEFAPAEFGN